jgi:hypothetical protein
MRESTLFGLSVSTGGVGRGGADVNMQMTGQNMEDGKRVPFDS